MAPTDVMNRPAWQFWMDARIRAAGTAWENTQREHATRGRRRPGTATDAEKQDLVDDQEARSETTIVVDVLLVVDAVVAKTASVS